MDPTWPSGARATHPMKEVLQLLKKQKYHFPPTWSWSIRSSGFEHRCRGQEVPRLRQELSGIDGFELCHATIETAFLLRQPVGRRSTGRGIRRHAIIEIRGIQIPNEKLNFAAIGSGGQGGSNIRPPRHRKHRGLCDVDDRRAAAPSSAFEKRQVQGLPADADKEGKNTTP